MNIFSRRAAIALAFSVPWLAQAQTFDDTVDTFFRDYLGWFANLIFTTVDIRSASFPLIAGWLLTAAVVFTLYFGFVQFRQLGLAIDIVRGRYSDPDHKEPGETSHFQALAMALSGTVGLATWPAWAWPWPLADQGRRFG